MAGASRATLRIVIVDDNANLRAALGSLLRTEVRFEVVGEAQNGMEALALCRKMQPDLVLMDLHMPVMDGLSAARALKRQLPATRVVIMTSDGDESVRRATSRAGADDFVLKTADGYKFLSQIGALF